MMTTNAAWFAPGFVVLGRRRFVLRRVAEFPAAFGRPRAEVQPFGIQKKHFFQFQTVYFFFAVVFEDLVFCYKTFVRLRTVDTHVSRL